MNSIEHLHCLRNFEESLFLRPADKCRTKHGPGNNVFKNALKGKDLSKMSEKEIIEAIYTERGSYNNKGKLKYFTKVSKDWKPKLINRFKEEKEAALQRLNQ